MASEVGIGLVGYGAIGRVHALCYRMLPLAYPDLPVTARIVAVMTPSAASGERARRELGDIAVTSDLETLLSRPDVTIVDCCAPTGDHARVANAALAAGKALFCEKPLAASAEESAAIAALARERGQPGGINFHFRQVPAVQEAHRQIVAGLLGDVYSFHLRYYRSSNLKRDRPLTWRFSGVGSGVLMDLGSHLIDLALHLLGPIVSVTAHTRTMITERRGPDGTPTQVESDDLVWLQVELAGGARGSIEASKVVTGAGDDLRIEAYGSNGALIFDTRAPNGLYIADHAGARTIATLSGTQRPAAIPGAETPTGWVQWHLASIAAFLAAFGSGTHPQPDLDDGVRVDRVIAAALRSAAQAGVPIQISI